MSQEKKYDIWCIKVILFSLKVCSGRVLKIFRPEELMAMVVGNEEYDWKALELNCEYKNGYTSSDETVSYK